jgi:hypothetical protein
VEIDRDTTEYLYTGWTGDPPATGADIAFMVPPARPTSGDWGAAIVVAGDSHPLWADAQRSGVTGDFYVAIKVGSFAGTSGAGVALVAGTDYQPWGRLTDTDERPVRVLPVSVEVL